MKLCGKLNGYCVHQNKDSCDGCQLMETWLKYKDKSRKLESEHMKKLLFIDDNGYELKEQNK